MKYIFYIVWTKFELNPIKKYLQNPVIVCLNYRQFVFVHKMENAV